MNETRQATALPKAALNAKGEPDAHHMRLIGHNDINGRGDCMHINVVDGYAYVAHMGENGIGRAVCVQPLSSSPKGRWLTSCGLAISATSRITRPASHQPA